MGSKSSSSSTQKTSSTQADNRVAGANGITVGAGARAVVAEEGGIAVRADGTVQITNFDEATIERLITGSRDVAKAGLDFSEDLGGDALITVRHAVDALRSGTEEALDAVNDGQATALGFGKSVFDESAELVEKVQLEAFGFGRSVFDEGIDAITNAQTEALGFAKAANDDALSIVRTNTETALEAARNADARISEFAIAATVAAVVLVVGLTSNPGLFA